LEYSSHRALHKLSKHKNRRSSKDTSTGKFNGGGFFINGGGFPDRHRENRHRAKATVNQAINGGGILPPRLID